MTTRGVAERLGGKPALEREVRSDLDLAEAIQEGFPSRTLDHVLESADLAPGELYRLVGSRRTLVRKKNAEQKLSAAESDRLARVVRVVGRAEEAFGDRAKAHRWLRKENRALAGRRPIDLLDSDAGARMVERELGRIEHGIIS